MSFWGASSTQKDAQGRLKDQAAQDSQAYKDWMNRAGGSVDKGNGLTDWATAYQANRAGAGIPTVADNTRTGEVIDPNLDGAIDARHRGLDQIATDWGNVPKAADTMANINGNLDQQGRNVGQNYDANQSEINDTYGRSAGRAEGAHGDIVGDLGARYNGLGKDVSNAYGDLRGKNESTYDDLLQKTEMLRPGSQFQQAQVARAYAPEVSNTLQRLRRSGVDPNSVQAVGALNSVERDRARGMDDAAARGTGAYLDAVTRLKGTQLNNEIGLSTDQLNKNTGLSLEQGNNFRGEQIRSSGVQTGLDQDRSSAAIGNRNAAYTEGKGVLDKRINAAGVGRDMAYSDFKTGSDLTREQSAAGFDDSAKRNDRYKMGADWQQRNLDEKNAGATAVGAQGNTDVQQGATQANIAGGRGDAATQSNQNVYNTEAANSGWGVKMLGGIAGAALGGWAGGGFKKGK